MTKLKDLPEGTLLISDNDRKGLYSNDNAPIFVMELGDKKASVLWQGTSRYDAFMHPLINKGDLEKNVDYVLPEGVGMLLPTDMGMGSFMPSDPDSFCSKGTDESSKETTDKYYVKMNDLSYLNVDVSGLHDNYWTDGIELSGNRIAFEASKKDTPWVHTLFTPDEYNSIAEEINQDGSWDEHLTLFDPDNPMFEKAEGTTESNKEKDDSEGGTLDEPTFKVHVGNQYDRYLNVQEAGVENIWNDTITLDDGRVIFASDDAPYNNVQNVFTLEEYKDIYNKVTSMDTNGEEPSHLPYYAPFDTTHFELVHGEHLPEDKGSEKAPTKEQDKEPKFTVQLTPYGDFLNERLVADVPLLFRGTVEGDRANLLNGYVLFPSDDADIDACKTHFTLEEYNDLREQVSLLEGHEDLSWGLPVYDPSDTAHFKLVQGESLPEDEGSEKAPKEKAKFTVQLAPYGEFLNEQLLADASSRLRGTADGDEAYLLNGPILFLDNDSEFDSIKTHFTLEEYNELREQVSLLEGSEKLYWSLPEYSPDNDSFVLAEGRHLPELVKESNKDVPKLPQWVKDILDNLVEDADDPTAFTKEINTLVQFMGDKNWGFYLYQKVRRMQSALKNHHYSKNEVVAASKLIVKEAKKYY